jgi:hypothetical protein
MRHRTFTFDTTHHALWAEEIAKEDRIPHEIVPSPPEANARCDIAIAILAEDVARMAGLLESSGVSFRIYVSPNE